MSLTIDQFSQFFGELYNNREPFPWQIRLAREVYTEGWPACIDLPTASGKTSTIDIAVFVLACQADRETRARKVGRRIYFTVNRRVIVDDAYQRSHDLAKKLLEAKSGILKEVADGLRKISGDENSPPLDVVQLRGGIYRDRAWARSITQPMVVCTTADQLGSRLLFRGYGVSHSMQPVHAALTACDSLILLDEAHITKAFSQTLQLIEKYRRLDNTSPPMRFVQMTATPTNDIKARFSLNADDLQNPILKARQEASKSAELVKLDKKKSVADEIIRRVLDALSNQHKAIGVIVNRVHTAREIYEVIQQKYPLQTHLVIGRMRPIDRDLLQEKLRSIVGPDRKDQLDTPCFVIATQCLEVGADYDFDVLITECASIDALRQRFGRLNRKGRTGPDNTPFQPRAAIVTNDASLVDDDPIYGSALKNTWAWLLENSRASIDFGISAFRNIWENVDAATQNSMSSPSPDAAVLLPAHLDFLCQTSPPPEPNPDVSYFIHGPKTDNREVNVCWRADLSADDDDWNKEVVALLPPISPECMTVPLHEVQRWMRKEKPVADADVPVLTSEEISNESGERSVVIYRNRNEIISSRDPAKLRPGDTVVIAAIIDPVPTLGHVPPPIDGKSNLDVAEEAYQIARRIRIVRVHPAIHPKLHEDLLKYATTSTEIVLAKRTIRELLGHLATGFEAGPDEIEYPNDKDGNPTGLLFRFNRLLEDVNPLRLPDVPEDDGENSSIESTDEVSLEKHTKDVVERVANSCDLLHLASLRTLMVKSADFHDLGKADIRFNAMLGGLTPSEAMERPHLLAKSGKRLLSKSEYDECRKRASLPEGFRHEMLSMQIVEKLPDKLLDASMDRELLLHLIAAHHGHARPFAPVVNDDANDETRSIHIKDRGINISPEQRQEWIESYRLDSGIIYRFWTLTRKYGWWGLAWFESILRLADQQASAAEEREVSR